MTATDTLLQMLQQKGMYLLFPLAVAEGPIVTVIAGWLVRLGVFAGGWAMALLVIADLVGDLVLYAIGRSGHRGLSQRWRLRLGLTESRMAELAAHFHEQGGRTLVFAKLTHSLGFAALVAAGAGGMRLAPFLWYNLLASVPKTLLLLGLGYGVGEAHVTIDTWIGRLSLVVATCLAIAVLAWFWLRRERSL